MRLRFTTGVVLCLPFIRLLRFNTGVLSSVQSVRARFSCFVTALPLLAESLFVPLSDGGVSTATTGGVVLLFDGGISIPREECLMMEGSLPKEELYCCLMEGSLPHEECLMMEGSLFPHWFPLKESDCPRPKCHWSPCQLPLAEHTSSPCIAIKGHKIV